MSLVLIYLMIFLQNQKKFAEFEDQIKTVEPFRRTFHDPMQ